MLQQNNPRLWLAATAALTGGSVRRDPVEVHHFTDNEVVN
ncbi:hypothetical protein K3495_g5559 [Podosphaera aphanis]|nr:hypothetical protein K3495_g5559 [Podosphaera aphanis]